MLRKIATIFLVIILTAGFLYQLIPVPKAHAGSVIPNAFDTYSSVVTGVLIEHQFFFTEPLGSIIEPNDYIILQMPNYTNITIANISLSGSFVYGDNTGLHASLSGTTITLT